MCVCVCVCGRGEGEDYINKLRVTSVLENLVSRPATSLYSCLNKAFVTTLGLFSVQRRIG